MPAPYEGKIVDPPRLQFQKSAISRERDVIQWPRYLLAGRPLPRIEDAVKIGELMRLAALSKFGWEEDESTGRRKPKAPPVISGRTP